MLAEAARAFVTVLLRKVRLVAIDVRGMLREGGKDVEGRCVW